MLRKILVFVLLICIAVPLWSLDMKNAEPYEDSEFPKWSLDLRRGEILFFGSLPVTFAATSLVTSLMNRETDYWSKIGIAFGASALIAVADYVIGAVSR